MGNADLSKLDEINILLDEINARRNDLNLREQFISKIMSAYLAVFFVIFGYAYKENVYFIFLLIPAFLASGMSLLLYQERMIYSLAAYIINIEDEVNDYFEKNYLNWEKVVSDINLDKKVMIIDGVLHFIVLSPFIIIYFLSLYYIFQYYYTAWYFLPTVGLYVLYFFILAFVFIYFGTRHFYEYSIQIARTSYVKNVSQLFSMERYD